MERDEGIETHCANPQTASDPPCASVVFFAPFVSSRMSVPMMWAGPKGVLNAIGYSGISKQTLQELLKLCWFQDQASYPGTTPSVAIVERHMQFHHVQSIGECIRTTVRLLSVDESRFRYLLHIHSAEDARLVASYEEIAVHVDAATGAVAPFPVACLANLKEMYRIHTLLSRSAQKDERRRRGARSRHMPDRDGTPGSAITSDPMTAPQRSSEQVGYA